MTYSINTIIYHGAIKMNPVDVKNNANTDSSKQSNKKDDPQI